MVFKNKVFNGFQSQVGEHLVFDKFDLLIQNNPPQRPHHKSGQRCGPAAINISTKNREDLEKQTKHGFYFVVVIIEVKSFFVVFFEQQDILKITAGLDSGYQVVCCGNTQSIT